MKIIWFGQPATEGKESGDYMVWPATDGRGGRKYLVWSAYGLNSQVITGGLLIYEPSD